MSGVLARAQALDYVFRSPSTGTGRGGRGAGNVVAKRLTCREVHPD